jgi:hypothetical protein
MPLRAFPFPLIVSSQSCNSPNKVDIHLSELGQAEATFHGAQKADPYSEKCSHFHARGPNADPIRVLRNLHQGSWSLR